MYDDRYLARLIPGIYLQPSGKSGPPVLCKWSVFLLLKGSVKQTRVSTFFLSETLKSTGIKTSVVDPKLFIPDPAFNFPSSGSGYRQKFRIHADPDPTCIN